MRIGVVGGGVVGRATARCFMEHGEVRVYDTMPDRATHSLFDTLDTDLIFVCLPTPQRENNSCDTSAITNFLGTSPRELNYVLRSTVPVGYTRTIRDLYKLPNLVHSPEFLTARCAITDAQLPARNIVGYPEYPSPKAWHPVAGLYATRFPGVPIHYMQSDESEAVKLFTNGYGATMVALFNEFYSLCEARGMDWDRVLAGLLSDGRIPHSWTRVPGPDGRRGFGGECLPKDLANLIACLGDEAMVTLAAHRRNRHDRERI